MRRHRAAVRHALPWSAAALLVPGTVGAQAWRPATDEPPAPERYVAYRAGGRISVDGTLDEAEWGRAPWSARFVDIEGRDAPRPALDTRVKLLWDDRCLYVAARLRESHVWATLTTRDTVIYYDDDFEVFLDPDGDTHHYYELEINAFGTVWDLLLEQPYRDGGPAVATWDIAGLESAVAVEGTINDPSDIDGGWTVELAIPFAALDEYRAVVAAPVDGEQWRVNFSRVDWPMDVVDGAYGKRHSPTTDTPHAESNWVWSPQGAINMHMPEMWGVVEFSTVVAGTDAIDPRPPDDADAQWQLRRVYYAEREYHRAHGRYAADLDVLGIGTAAMLSVRLSGDGYVARAVGRDGVSVWRIREDGRVWRTMPEGLER